jgi:hypothetical protein
MQRRAFKRVPANIRVRFYCYDTAYLGTVTNLSENGMFISTDKMLFPFDSRIEIIFSTDQKLLKVPVRVIRITKSEDVFNGMGVELMDTHGGYLELVNSLKCTVDRGYSA